METDTDQTAATDTASLGTSSDATQASEPATTLAASETGTEQATPADATTAQSTTDTSSETPQQRLERELTATAKVPLPSAPLAAQQPSIPPELQKILNSPEETKRLLNLNSLYGRQVQELGAARQQLKDYQGLPPAQQLREQIAQQQKQADALKLTPFNARHPDYARNMSRVSRAQHWKAAYDLATPEQQSDPNWRARLADGLGGVTGEDLKLLEDHKAAKHEVEEEFHRDPEEFVVSRVEQRIDQKLAQFEQFMQSRQQASQFMTQNHEVLDKHRDAVLWGMSHPDRRDVGLRLAQLEAENEALRNQRASQTEVVEVAKARDAITKTRATVKRDAASDPAQSIEQIARKEGWGPKKTLEAMLKEAGHL